MDDLTSEETDNDSQPDSESSEEPSQLPSENEDETLETQDDHAEQEIEGDFEYVVWTLYDRTIFLSQIVASWRILDCRTALRRPRTFSQKNGIST